MILRPLVTSSCISWKAHCLGRVFLVDQRRRNTQILRKRRRKLPSKKYAKINQRNSKSSCITVEVWASHRIPTTAISLAFLKDVWRGTVMILRTQTSSGIKIVSCLRKKPLKDRCLMSSRKSQLTRRMNETDKWKLIWYFFV